MFIVAALTNNGPVRFQLFQPDADHAEAKVRDLMRRYSRAQVSEVLVYAV